MADEKLIPDEEFEADIYTLTDESGKESQFELIGTTEYQGVTYMAMTPFEDDSGEYVILKVVKDEDGKLVWECPCCKNRDQSQMNVARRTCGYIGTQYWNQGRTQEIKERVLHL